MERQDAEAKTEESREADVAATGVAEVVVSARKASAQQGASEYEAIGVSGGGAAAVAPVQHPLAPIETPQLASSGWSWNSEAAPFTPAARTAGWRDLDEHSAAGAATISVAAEAYKFVHPDETAPMEVEKMDTKRKADVDDLGGGSGGSDKQPTELQGPQAVETVTQVAAVPAQVPPQLRPTQAKHATSPPQPPFHVGQWVQIHGLLGSPELNGRLGRIISFVTETSRIQVCLQGGTATKGIRAANLRTTTSELTRQAAKTWTAAQAALFVV
jgi:hypothetical protein